MTDLSVQLTHQSPTTSLVIRYHAKESNSKENSKTINSVTISRAKPLTDEELAEWQQVSN